MSIETNLKGRIRNTALPVSYGIMPVFEAVSNSIHAIEEADLSDGKITVQILRGDQTQFDFKKRGPEPNAEITGFKIIDNGAGFNNENMKSFETLDSEYKAKQGGRGIGRLLWLKAFDTAKVESVYQDPDEQMMMREFVFNANSGVVPLKDEGTTESTNKTIVQLSGFHERYRKGSAKTASAIANSLLEHCLWYFVRPGGAPEIVIQDSEEIIKLDEIYDQHMISSTQNESIVIKDVTFDLIHIKLRSSKNHAIAFCAANRLVLEENLKIPGLHGKLNDEDGEFVYSCYVTSKYLDDHVRSERIDFDIVEDTKEMFDEIEISLSDIREGVVNKASEYLATYLEDNKKKTRERVDKFVSQKVPRYRPILARIPGDKLDFDPHISDKELEILLHRQYAEIESQLLEDGQKIMQPQNNESIEDYQERVSEYLQTLQDIKKSDLANYVSHRKVVLDLLEKAISADGNGSYAREELIHELIMPRHKDSNDVSSDNCNLWLIDERLSFHDYLASDKSISSMPITGAEHLKRPDILALNIYDDPMLVAEGENFPLASIEVIELKRPMRNDASEGDNKDPIDQALDYLKRVRNGEVKTRSGRPIPKSESIPGFCYIICDITPTIEKQCDRHDAQPTSDNMGYFFYHKQYSAFVEIISFNKLVKSAKERNRAFFDKLGLPTT